MIAFIATDFAGKVHQDYENNFMPRKEIDLRLTFEEMKEFLQDETFQKQIRLTWHFKFYVKQLFWLSWNKIDQSGISIDLRIKMFDELDQIVKFANFNETRALVTFINVSFFLKRISIFDLYDIFFGHSNYDDYCAQIAYEEYNLRGRK